MCRGRSRLPCRRSRRHLWGLTTKAGQAPGRVPARQAQSARATSSRSNRDMHVHVALPAKRSSVRLRFDPEDRLSEQDYLAFCRLNPDLRVERSAEGEIIIEPPPGGESSYRSMGVATQLNAWASKDRRGKVFDSSAQFILPDGSALSPGVALWGGSHACEPTSMSACLVRPQTSRRRRRLASRTARPTPRATLEPWVFPSPFSPRNSASRSGI